LLSAKEADRQKKQKFKRELQQQVIESIIKREKDRLYLPEKDLVTSGGLMKNLGIQMKTSEQKQNTG